MIAAEWTDTLTIWRTQDALITIEYLVFAVCAGAYLAGSVPSGFVISRLGLGIDIRQLGSGNIGAANVYRTAGRGAAALTLSMDTVKGFLPILAAQQLGLPLWGLLLAGLAAIAGHNWSLFLRGRGGKGVATSIGVVAGIAPVVAVAAILVWLGVIFGSRYASLASLAMLASVAPFMAIFDYTELYWIFGLAIAFLAIVRHRANINRLLAGTELKLGAGASTDTATGGD